MLKPIHLNPIFSFRLFRRRRQRTSIIFFILGGLGLFMACGLTTCGVPASILRWREVAALDQPAPAELDRLPPGTTALFTGQIPPDAAAEERGLALWYVEERPEETFVEGDDGEERSQSRSWTRTTPPPGQVMLTQTNGRLLTVQLPENVTFMEAQIYEEGEPSNPTRRTVGFLPGQALTIEGSWQGNDLLIADTLFAGSPDSFVTAVRAMPGQMLIFGLICGVISLLLLGFGLAMRLTGR